MRMLVGVKVITKFDSVSYSSESYYIESALKPYNSDAKSFTT